MWENVITLNLKNEDFKMEWRKTFTGDLEGTFQKVSITIITNLIFIGKSKMLTCLYGFRNQRRIRLNSTAQRPKYSVVLIQTWLLLSRSVL